MPKIEVDEEQWNFGQRTLATMRKIASDPTRARKLEALHKETDATVSTPLADADKIANERVAKLEQQLDELRKSTEEQRKKDEEEKTLGQHKGKWEAGRQKLRDQGFTDAAIEKIEKEIMEPKGMIDHEDALVLYEKKNPPPTPVMPGGSGPWNFLETPPDDKDSNVKRLIDTRGNSDVLTDKMARDALNEFRHEVAQASRRR